MFVFKILKDSEDYTNEHFDDLLNRVFHSEVRLGGGQIMPRAKSSFYGDYSLTEIIQFTATFY